MNPGDKLGPYEILAAIGAGGMGEVYKARDTRLDRIVAIKTSQQKFNERFAREARAIAALNHPNICHLYDVGPDYLVMEFIDGTPLKGPLPIEKAVEYGGQILDALAAAHKKGITHRDLKPANILVTKSAIKLLDFGLAKQSAPLKETDETTPLTGQGQILGTLQYMSPEQLQGKDVDARSDLFSFGCVLYELLTGKRAFAGESSASVIAAILERDPEPMKTAKPLDRIVRRALAKDPDQRFQTSCDLKAALNWAMEQGPQVAAVNQTRSMWPWAAFVAAMLVLAALAFVHFRETPPEAPVIRTQILPPDKTTFNFPGNLSSVGPVALSPDGLKMVFSAMNADGKNHLWIRRLDSSTAQPLAGTESAIHPFWSPNSRFIGFFAGDQLRKIDASGGPPVSLCSAPASRGGTWNQDDIILFANNTPRSPTAAGIFRVPAAGGVPAPVPLDVIGRWPWFLPDGRHFVYSAVSSVRLGSLDSKETKLLVETISDPEYSLGQLIYLRDDMLMAQPFDLTKLALTGEAVPIAERVVSVGNLRRGIFSVSQNGLLAFQSGSVQGNRIAWTDRSGKALDVLATEFNDPFGIELSPDQKSLGVQLLDTGKHGFDFWLYRFDRNSLTRFTFNTEPRGGSAVWSPDGATIAFTSQKGGKSVLYRKSANLSGTEELLYADQFSYRVTDWSADGKWILCHRIPSGGVFAVPLEGERKPVQLVQSDTAYFGRLSPDGRWLAYTSNESGNNELWVIPVPGPGGKVQVSTGQGMQPRWRKDGKEIFFLSLTGLMAADVTVKNGALEIGRPHQLFTIALPTTTASIYDVSPDGQRFLVIATPESSAQEPLTLVQNWTSGLKK